MDTKGFVYGTGAIAFMPFILAFVGTFLSMVGGSALLLGTGGGLGILMGFGFTAHLWATSDLDATSKILWTISLIILLPVVAAPYYWYQYILPDLAWEKFRRY